MSDNKKMDNKNKYLTLIWGLVIALLLGVCVYEYFALSYNLKSLFDEGYFYTQYKYSEKIIAYTCPPSLSMKALNILIPNIEQCDILTMRRYEYSSKCMALLFLMVCSCWYIYNRFKDKRIHSYMALVATNLLIGVLILPSVAFSWDAIVFDLVTIVFGLCLLYSVASKEVIKNICVVVVGVAALLTMLCNLPAGCMLAALCAVYMVIIDSKGIKESASVVLCGLLGMVMGFLITHFFIISGQDIHSFIQNGIMHTTSAGQTDAHSLKSIILVILFGIRDLLITTLLLCGITYAGKIIQMRYGKSWLTIVSALICFLIVYKWQAKPVIQIGSILCWLTIMFLTYHTRINAIDKRDLLLILFAFILPIGTAFGTNTHIIGKANSCCASWGLLLFLLYYLSRGEVRKFLIVGLIVASCCIIGNTTLPNIFDSHEQYCFDHGSPIARMHLNENQKAFYEEVYKELTEHRFEVGKDTLLGFCFNEMTVPVMGYPYTNDPLPEDFLLHDIEDFPAPKYIILSEWDSVILYSRFKELQWGFPERYTYYKCINNADPYSGYNRTQSIIFCAK